MKRLYRSGFSLLELLIVSALVGSVAMYFASSLITQQKNQKRSELKMDRNAIAQSLLGSIGCNQTLATTIPAQFPTLAACEGQLTNVYSANGSLLISNNNAAPTRIGSFTVRAICHSTSPPLGYEIQMARVKDGVANPLSGTHPDTDFVADPMMPGNTPTWNNPVAARLFPAGGYPCAGSFNPTCVFTCPSGQYMTGYNPDTRCVNCAPLPSNDCPPDMARIGSTCEDIVSGSPTSFITRMSGNFRINCRVVENLTSAAGGHTLSCNANEFVAGGGANCVDPLGHIHFGTDPTHNPGGILRYPGYTHTNWPESVSSFRSDCYGVPADSVQGNTTARIICCSLRPVYP